MGNGFQVDLGALEDAAAGVNRTLFDLQAQKVDVVDGSKGAYGHDHLASTVADFCDRWELGVEHLATDAQQIAGRLSQSVQAYLQVDQGATGQFDGMYGQPTGEDPGVH